MVTIIRIEQDTRLAHNIAFVVRKVELDLRQAAKFNAELMVTVKVTKIKKASLVFEQQVLAKDGSVHCQATVLAACIDNQAMKAVAIPEPIISRIQSGFKAWKQNYRLLIYSCKPVY